MSELSGPEDLDIPRGSLPSRAGWLFTAVWLVYLGYPLGDLFKGHPGAGRIAYVMVLIGVFCVAYILVAVASDREMDRLPPQRLGDRRKLILLGTMGLIATVLAFSVDVEWVVLWIYVASGCGLSLQSSPLPAPGP